MLKELITRVYREALKLNNQKKPQMTQLKMGKGLEKTVLQRRYANGQEAHEKHMIQ